MHLGRSYPLIIIMTNSVSSLIDTKIVKTLVGKVYKEVAQRSGFFYSMPALLEPKLDGLAKDVGIISNDISELFGGCQIVDDVERVSKEIALKRNANTKVFELKQNGIFNEDKDTIYSRLLDLTFDWNEIQDDGLELDDELPEGQKAIRYSPDDIYVERRDFTISSIIIMKITCNIVFNTI